MVRARIRMFGPRLVVMLGRTRRSRTAAAPQPGLADLPHGCGWDAIESAVQSLTRNVAQQLVRECTPEQQPLR